jgi:putative glutathione S-transferase
MEKTALAEVVEGVFKRSPPRYRGGTPSEDEMNDDSRFVLYISYACPWANRTLAVVYLKGLEDQIRVSVVHPVWQRTRPEDPADTHCGWVFRDEHNDPVSTANGHGSFDCRGCVPDPLGHRCIRDLYNETYDTKFTVPVLYDSKRKVGGHARSLASPIHALAHPRTRPSTHSPIHALAHPRTRPSTRSPIHALTHPRTHASFRSS